eukprot:2801922-Prymnesium_polylepis.1
MAVMQVAISGSGEPSVAAGDELAAEPHVLYHASAAPLVRDQPGADVLFIVVVRQHAHPVALARVPEHELVVVRVRGRQRDAAAPNVALEQIGVAHGSLTIFPATERPGCLYDNCLHHPAALRMDT